MPKFLLAFFRVFCWLFGHKWPEDYKPKESALQIRYEFDNKYYRMVFHPCLRCGMYTESNISEIPKTEVQTTTEESTPEWETLH